MSNIVTFDHTPSPEDEAAAWIARIDQGPLTPADRNQLFEWLHADPRNRVLLDQNARAWALSSSLAKKRARPAAVSRRKAMRAIAASVAVLVVSGTLLLNSGGYSDRVATQVGESRTVTLPDGSRVTLNTRTEIAVRFDGHTRNIVLEQGEALFDVAHDPSRPFEVRAGTTTTRAIGTRFAVRLVNPSRVSVVVTEGSVQVRRDDRGSDDTAPVVRLSAGQSAVGSRAAPLAVTRLDQNDIERATGWSQGGIPFRNERLGDVIGEVNRYSTDPIRLADPTLADVRVSGYFAIGNTAAFVSALSAGAGLVTSKEADGAVTLSRS